VASGSDVEYDAAEIWALAKARRDQEPGPPDGQAAVPGIRRRLALPGAELHVVRRDGLAVGFTVFAPRVQSLEVFYLAVHPDHWGAGVARRLLTIVDERARTLERFLLELWVIDDNERAVGVYERAGWVATGALKQEAPDARVERRFVRRLAGSAW
jgi:GNAT superfamily N-acetyltransferase